MRRIPASSRGCCIRIPRQQAASQYMRMFCTPEAEEILSRDGYQALIDIVLTTA